MVLCILKTEPSLQLLLAFHIVFGVWSLLNVQSGE